MPLSDRFPSFRKFSNIIFLAGCGILFGHSCNLTGAIQTPVSPTPTGAAETRISASPLPPTSTFSLTQTLPLPEAPVVTPTGPPACTGPAYWINAVLDIRKNSEADDPDITLTVHEQARFTNRSADSIRELVLQMEPSRAGGGFQLVSFAYDRLPVGQAVEPADQVLRIPSDPPLAPGEVADLVVDYVLQVPKKASTVGWNELQITLGDWYAFFPVYREGEGWLAHPVNATGEHLSYPYAEFHVQLDVRGDTEYKVAASAPPKENSLPLDFEFTGRSFAISLTKGIRFDRTAAGIKIAVYTEREDYAQGLAVTDTVAKSLELFSSIFGPYPHETFSMLESDLPDGMEYDGLIFLGRSLFPYYTNDERNYLTAIAAHETAHQWWYGLVGSDHAMEPWLDEALAAYSELLFYETYYPDSVDWWWDTRIRPYPSSECVDQPIYHFSAFRPYVNAVYLRGVQFLDALRDRMGDPEFLAALKDLQDRGRGGEITAADFYGIFSARSPRDLEDIWRAFLCRPPDS